MHRMLATIFKVLGISIILMFLLSLVLNVADIITVNRRVEAVSVILQQELEENDCIPTALASTFQTQLNNIVANSSVAYKIDWNLDNSLTDKNGQLAQPIDQNSISQYNINYGDQLELVIKVYMQPHFLAFFSNPSTNGGSYLGQEPFSYVDTYSWTVPALRYLK